MSAASDLTGRVENAGKGNSPRLPETPGEPAVGAVRERCSTVTWCVPGGELPANCVLLALGRYAAFFHILWRLLKQ